MSGSTPELALKTAQDSDDTADYLVLSLASSLQTLDALFNNATGHSHSGAHQGGPIGSIPASAIPDGAITSAKIADGTIATGDIAVGAISKGLVAPGVSSSPITTSTTFVTVPDLQLTLDVVGNGTIVYIWLAMNVSHSLAGGVANVGLQLDSAGEVGVIGNNAPAASAAFTMSTVYALGLTPGTHTIKARWSTNTGTLTSGGAQRYLMACAHMC